MTTPSANQPRTAAPSVPAPAGADLRHPRTPLPPGRVGESIGQDTDAEFDVAPNLGGEERMQDA